MNICVVDASVAVKWFVPEDNSSHAIALASEKDKLLVPDLFFAEFANAVLKKTRLEDLPTSKGVKIVQALLNAPLAVYGSAQFIATAFDIASHINENIYDCLYLAMALTFSCPFVTADRNFYRTASRTGFGDSVVLLGQRLK